MQKRKWPARSDLEQRTEQSAGSSRLSIAVEVPIGIHNESSDRTLSIGAVETVESRDRARGRDLEYRTLPERTADGGDPIEVAVAAKHARAPWIGAVLAVETM